MLFIIAFLVAFAVGAFVGTLITWNAINHRSSGALRIDRSDPDGPYMFLELERSDAEKIMQNGYVTLRVDTKSYISQK